MDNSPTTDPADVDVRPLHQQRLNDAQATSLTGNIQRCTILKDFIDLRSEIIEKSFET